MSGPRWTLSADSSSAERATARTADGFGKVGAATEVTATTFRRFAIIATGVNQALELSLRLLGMATAAYRSTAGRVLTLSGETAALADDVAKTARAYGLATDELQGFRSAAGFAGIEAAQADRAFLNIARSALDASRGLSTAVDLFAMAGLEIKNENGELKSAGELIRDLSANLRDGLIPAQQEAAISAQLLRDRSGKMILALKEGPEIVEENTARLREWRTLMDDELLASSEAFVDSQQKMREALQGTRNEIARGMIPQWTALNESMADTIGRANAVNPLLDYLGGAGGPLDKIGQLAIEIGFALSALPDVVATAVSTALFAIESAMAKVLATVAEGLDKIAAFGKELPGAAGRYFEKFAEGADLWSAAADKVGETAQRNLDVAAASFLAIEEASEGAAAAVEKYREALEKIRGGAKDGAIGSGAQAAGIVGAGGEGADITIDTPTVYDFTAQAAEDAADATESAQQEMINGWKTMETVVVGLGQKILALGQKSKVTGGDVLGMVGSVIQMVTPFLGPVAGAAGSAISSVLGLIGGAIGDRGLLPTVIADRGANLAGIPGGGSHSVVIKRNDEMVLDPTGTSVVTRMLAMFEDQMAGNGGRGFAGGPAGGGSVTVVNDRPIVIDGREIARVMDSHLYDMRAAGEGMFAAGVG